MSEPDTINPSEFKFEFAFVQDSEDPDVGGGSISFTFLRPDIFSENSLYIYAHEDKGTQYRARQAFVINRGTTMKDVGRALCQLGEFFQNPDPSQICWDADLLTGNELIVPEVHHPDLMISPV